ncbi:MAG TPA: 2-hydroxyacid dehydrogenase [Mycobacteriales bacterium]|nr:2-hydroxyacid dehydrogenase [Mycobacteriales bacterium]
MVDVVAWVQWPDFEGPVGVTILTPADGELTGELLQRITFYVPTYTGAATWLEQVPAMTNLQVLQLPNAGYDDALGYLRPGLTLCNARGVHDASTAELAVGLAIAGRRGFGDFFRNQPAGRWQHERRPALADSLVAIIGFGSIGRSVARMLGGFDVEVVGFSRSGTDGAERIDQLPGRIGEFDVVVLTLPLTPESAKLFDAELLAAMKDGALLVNIARGGIVDTGALLAELQSGRLFAALDVTDPEPLPAGHPLWQAPGVVITPHVGGDTTAFEPRARRLVHDQLTRLVNGEPLANVVAVG